MSYLVLARKWRPQQLSELLGQEPIARTLSNALTSGRIAHAFLFTGARGVGKTSAARILAKAMSCEKGDGPTATPCGECSTCVEIQEGRASDVFEIDAASNTGVGNVRDIIDNVRGAKVAGSGFPVYKGAGSRLQRSLISYFLDVHTAEHGFTEVWPPAVVNTASARGTGQIPDKEDQMYVVTRDDLYLIPTAEVPVTNLHRDEILEPGTLPIRYAAYSASFRREAGAAGRDTRGILRVHQFDKVEMVSFTAPGESDAELERLTAHAESLLQRLGLAYRVLLMSTREMGFVQARKYDLEVWAPGVERWLEVSSVSNFRDYQARRMAIRHRPEAGAAPELVHTLNGSGLAVGRTLVAILENYQQQDGSVIIPEALRPFMNGQTVISAKGSHKG